MKRQVKRTIHKQKFLEEIIAKDGLKVPFMSLCLWIENMKILSAQQILAIRIASRDGGEVNAEATPIWIADTTQESVAKQKKIL